mmetsp:Transcript_31799/g.70062  ORF Transcript_31799/g.70062 Transcript_31799/m.70062 type:complete len:186 (-) Transcript_31799:1795-2352(-)
MACRGKDSSDDYEDELEAHELYAYGFGGSRDEQDDADSLRPDNPMTRNLLGESLRHSSSSDFGDHFKSSEFAQGRKRERHEHESDMSKLEVDTSRISLTSFNSIGSDMSKLSCSSRRPVDMDSSSTRVFRDAHTKDVEMMGMVLSPEHYLDMNSKDFPDSQKRRMKESSMDHVFSLDSVNEMQIS